MYATLLKLLLVLVALAISTAEGGPGYPACPGRGAVYREGPGRGPAYREGPGRGPAYREGPGRGPAYREGIVGVIYP